MKYFWITKRKQAKGRIFIRDCMESVLRDVVSQGGKGFN